MNTPPTSACWNTSLYETNHAFVWQYGESLLEVLAPQAGERILDLGCGTGQLTDKLASRGANVVGIDNSAEMIAKARQNYPLLQFEIANAQSFQFDQPFDAVFSNAVLHWIKAPDAVISCVRQALKPGGRFVAEFGGKGNVEAIVTALSHVLNQPDSIVNPWYFPSIGDYATRLEQRGFDVTVAVLFDRPTPLSGEAGIANWLQMFAGSLLAGVPLEERSAVIQAVEDQLRPTLYRDGGWFADYRRLRLVAFKL